MNEIEEERFEVEEEETPEQDGIDYFYRIDNNFVKHLTASPKSHPAERFYLIPSPIPNSILYTTAEFYEVGKYATPLNISTLLIRDKLIGPQFKYYFAELIAGRQSILFTSRSFQQRVEFREQFCMAATAFLLQHFVLKHEVYYQKIMARVDTKNGGKDRKLPSIFTFSNPGVLVLAPTVHQAWRVNYSILGCIPNLVETNIRGRRKLDKYAPDSYNDVFRCDDMALLPDEIPDNFLERITFYKCADYYISKTGNQEKDFFFGFSFFRQVHKIEMMCRIRKADVLYGSVGKILEYGKYYQEDEDFSFLAGIHTVYIEDLDRIATENIVKLKTLLAYISRRPKMIQNVDVTLLTPNCKNFAAVRSVQYVCSYRGENEYSNLLFDPQSYDAPFDVPLDSIDDEPQKMKTGEVNVQLIKEANCARNQLGMLKLNMTFSRSIFDNLCSKIMIQKIYELQHLSLRKTDGLPEGVIKFDLSRYPKLDYLINKELVEIEGPVCIILPNMPVFERFTHVIKLLKIWVSYIALGATKEDARKHIKRIKKNITRILVITEDEMQRSFYAFPKFWKIVFYSPPRDYELFRYIYKTEPECSRIYWDDDDAFRWSNLVLEDYLAKILRNTVVLM